MFTKQVVAVESRCIQSMLVGLQQVSFFLPTFFIQVSIDICHQLPANFQITLVYPGKNLWDRWCLNGPPFTLFGVSDSGWMEQANFHNWFEKMFLNAVDHLLETGPVVLIMDGHGSHILLKLIQSARKHNVHLIAVPAHTTHITQPLDVGLFSAMKAKWRQIMDNYRHKTAAATVDKSTFPSLIAQLWENDWASALKSGFQKTGIYPFCPSAVPDHKLVPSEVFHEENSEDDRDGHDESTSTVECSFSTTVHIRNPQATPAVKTFLNQYFKKVLQETAGAKAAARGATRRKVGLTHYGEALTADEVFQRLQKAQAMKVKAQAKR